MCSLIFTCLDYKKTTQQPGTRGSDIKVASGPTERKMAQLNKFCGEYPKFREFLRQKAIFVSLLTFTLAENRKHFDNYVQEC